MSAVEFPDQRINLITAVDFLANSDNKQIITTENNGILVEYYDFDMSIHQIFDDMGDFAENPNEFIGYILRNTHEASAMSVLIEKLNEVLDFEPPVIFDRNYVRSDRWQAVISAARSAAMALTG